VHNFDNVWNGMSVLFLMITTDGWADFMFMMVDSTGVKLMPVKENGVGWAYFAIALIVISNFLILNFYAGVLMETFSNEKNKLGGLHSLTNAQKHWVDLQSFIVHQEITSRVRKPKNPIRMKLFAFWTSTAWTVISNLLIVVGSLCFWMEYHRQPSTFALVLKVMLGVTYVLFAVEVILRVFTYGLQFYRHKALMLDLVLLLIEGVSRTHPGRLDPAAGVGRQRAGQRHALDQITAHP
jgi:hypothetical protein